MDPRLRLYACCDRLTLLARTCASFSFFSFSNLPWITMSVVVVCYFSQLGLVVPGQPYRLVYMSSLLERWILPWNTIMSYIGLRTQLGTTQRLPQFVGTESRLCGEELQIILFSWSVLCSYTGILRKYVIKWLRCYQRSTPRP